MPNRPGFMDEIRCDEKDYLIWKWRPCGSSQRENALRWGSSLRVRDGSVAAFVYRRNGGQIVQDYIAGPFEDTIKTSNLPVIASVIGAAYAGGTPWQAEVYFINLAKVVQSRFAVRYFDVFDPRLPDFGVPVAVRGTITFHIVDYKGFVELHRLDEFTLNDFEAQVKDAVSRRVKTLVGKMPAEQNIPLLQLAGMTDVVSKAAQDDLEGPLKDVFGVAISSFDISAIDVDKESEGFRQLKALTQDVTAATIRAQTEANIKNIHDMQRIQMQNLAESLRIEREEGQYAIHMNTQSANMPAVQVEAQRAVGIAGAEALGHLGENGATAVGFGGGGGAGGGLDMAGIAAGMAVGGAVGQNLANTMNGMMAGVGVNGVQSAAASSTASAASSTDASSANGPKSANSSETAPPPIPSNRYFVVANGSATGPFDTTTLRNMAAVGSLGTESLVWREGMADWAKASAVNEVASILADGAGTPPPIPE